MVLLTITPAIAQALAKAKEVSPDKFAKLQLPSEPLLAEPKPGDPVSHSQLIDLSKLLKKHASKLYIREDEEAEKIGDEPNPISDSAKTQGPASDRQEEPTPITLDFLLRGSKIYIAPPPPKPEPSAAYKALMARLRVEEEAREYERMINPPLKAETFAQRFPNPHFTGAPLSIGGNSNIEEDDVSYEEVHRQIVLIINVLVSIIACAVFIWVAARHWSVPKRLGLSMGGSGAVAIAEVAVYSGYVRRVQEAKRKEKKKPEIKEIVQSWVIDRSDHGKETDISSGAKERVEDGVRYRKGKHR